MGKGTTPDIGDNATEVANNLIDTLGVDPCMLSMIIVVIASFALIVYNNKHAKDMAKLNVEQLQRLLDKNK